MKIRGWSIHHLDSIHEYAASDLPDGLTVVHGANESGKSQLLELLARLLFGVVGSSAPAVPEHSDRGHLVVDDGADRVVIERALDRPAAPVLRRPDGRAVEPGALRNLLGGADERLFRAVFACSVDDIRSLAAFDSEALREMLFSTSLAGAGRSARAALHRLRGQAALRLDADGAAQINRLISELNALRLRLNTARHAALAYADRRAAADGAAGAVAAQRSTLAARRAARGRDDALLRAWPAWQQLQAARAELTALEPVEELSDELEAELRAASTRLRTAEAALSARRAEHAEAERVGTRLPASGALAGKESEVEALYGDLPLHRFHLTTLPGLRTRCGEAQQRLNDQLRRSGADWSMERLRAWTAAGLERDRARDWHMRSRTAAEQLQQARWRLEAAQTLSAAARRERDLAVSEGSTSGGFDAEEVARRRRVLGEVRAAKKEMLARRARAEATEQALREHLLAPSAHPADDSAWPPAWLAPSLLGGAIGAGAAAVWWLGIGVPLFGLGAIVIAGVASAAARWSRQWHHVSALQQEERRSARRTLHSEIEAARRVRDAERQRAAQAAERLARHAQAIDLSRSPSAAQLTECERALDDAVAAEARAALARARLSELESACGQREAEEEARARDLAAAAAAQAALDREWAAWAVGAGFGSGATPDLVLDGLAALESAQGALAAFETAAREVCEAESLIAAWEVRARAALTSAQPPSDLPLSGPALIDGVLALWLRVQSEAPGQARRAAIVEEVRARAGRLEIAEAEAAHCRQHVASLLRAAGARDEADLDRRRAAAERRRNLQRAIADQERAVREHLGDEQSIGVLASGAIEAWREGAAAAENEIRLLEHHLDQLVAEEEQARAACRGLEHSADVASLETEWAALMAELGAAVREWRGLAAAAGLVEDAWQTFDRTRQPAVLRAASDVFAAVTGGRYERVVQDERAEGLLALAAGGRWKQVDAELGRSASEQLFLSIRLGLAREFARRGIALPLMLDDVLVNFDPERARRMAEVLGMIAREQQVLFATCHPEVRDLLVRHGQAERVIEL